MGTFTTMGHGIVISYMSIIWWMKVLHATLVFLQAFLSEELCRLLGPPIDKLPLIPPTPTPSSDSTPPNSRKKVHCHPQS